MLTVAILREAFRNYVAFGDLFESEGIDTLAAPGGLTINWFDLQYLHEQLYRLPPRQRQAIELCLVQNMREQDAAGVMGVSPTNPVAMYATLGLQKLVVMADTGLLPRFQETPKWTWTLIERRAC